MTLAYKLGKGLLNYLFIALLNMIAAFQSSKSNAGIFISRALNAVLAHMT